MHPVHITNEHKLINMNSFLQYVHSFKLSWKEVHGKYPEQADVDAIYKDFVPMQLACIRQYGTLLPDCADTMNKLKKEFNMKIGCTTGSFKVLV